jgi:hypothetical protein
MFNRTPNNEQKRLRITETADSGWKLKPLQALSSPYDDYNERLAASLFRQSFWLPVYVYSVKKFKIEHFRFIRAKSKLPCITRRSFEI